MTQANVQLVQDVYAAFGRGDIAAILERVTDDVEWIDPGPAELPWTGSRRGREGVLTFFQNLGQAATFDTFDPRDFIADGDRVVVLGSYTGRANTTGLPFAADFAMVWSIRDGKVRRFHNYADTSTTAKAYVG